MKIEIEKANNGYIITIPPAYEDEIEKKFVIEELEEDINDIENLNSYLAFNNLVLQLQDIFEVHNSKHHKVGFVSGVCSEDKRWKYQNKMKQSLLNPQDDNGD